MESPPGIPCFYKASTTSVCEDAFESNWTEFDLTPKLTRLSRSTPEAQIILQ